VSNENLDARKLEHGAIKVQWLLLLVFVMIPVLTILIATLAPKKKTLYEECQAKCSAVNKSFRLEPKGPPTTKQRYLQYECICS